MKLLVSGEGPTDLGKIHYERADAIEPGPMLLMLNQMIEHWINYDLWPHAVQMVPKKNLTEKPRGMRGIPLPRQREIDQGEFFYNAHRLGKMAVQCGEEDKIPVIAVFFRDCDGTASSESGLWDAKWNSILNGFKRAGFEHGVPMLPKPKSEAWLLCAFKENPYQSCAALENESGNDDSPHNLKSQLTKALGAEPSREVLCDCFHENKIDAHRINMPSFRAFKQRLGEVLATLCPMGEAWPPAWGQKINGY